MRTERRAGGRWGRRAALAGAVAVGLGLGGRAAAQAPAAPAPAAAPMTAAAAAAEPTGRVVAFVYGTVPVTREELGEFLIARGGAEKLELLVNKKIIEIECQKRGVTVTPQEIEAGLNEDLKGLSIDRKAFIEAVLPKYGKSLYEWTEDVIRPRLLLGKLVRDKVKVTDEDLTRAFENRYGEKRDCKIIIWPKGEEKVALQTWEKLRNSDDEFDRAARGQADPYLAAGCGRIAPIGRNTEAPDPTVENVAFSLRPGEVSQLFQANGGTMCVKCVGVLPPDKTVTLEKVRPDLEKEVYDRKISKAIPEFFKSLKDAAKPELLLRGGFTPAEFREGVKALSQEAIQRTNGTAEPQK